MVEETTDPKEGLPRLVPRLAGEVRFGARDWSSRDRLTCEIAVGGTISLPERDGVYGGGIVIAPAVARSLWRPRKWMHECGVQGKTHPVKNDLARAVTSSEPSLRFRSPSDCRPPMPTKAWVTEATAPG